MDFKYRVISQLNNEQDLILSASNYFKEPFSSIENAVNLITDATIAALNFQCAQNKKTDEIFKIGKECAILKFSTLFSSDFHIVEKGRGINSEIFGVDLVHTIDEIAKKNAGTQPNCKLSDGLHYPCYFEHSSPNQRGRKLWHRRSLQLS
ncbi:hypothetical protein KRR40_10170 [Niabella defluvii]|nr:hypothetical protein KRR40_10170 [Niabella sp. I65]